jgi:hypothetical protein
LTESEACAKLEYLGREVICGGEGGGIEFGDFFELTLVEGVVDIYQLYLRVRDMLIRESEGYIPPSAEYGSMLL